MKKPQPSKRTLVIVERRKLPLDFSFDAPKDGQKIKKMRMLDTSAADTATLTHIVSTNDALDQRNLTINHCDSQTNTSPNTYLKRRVEEEVEIECLDETDVANSDTEVDIEGVDDEQTQQIAATSKAKRDDLAQSVASLQVSGDQQGKEEPTSSTRRESSPTPKPTQNADSTEPVAKAQPSPTNLLGKAVTKCHLCPVSCTKFFELRTHYLSAHDLTIPKLAKRPDLQPDPNNADDFCHMCQRKYKNRVTFAMHLRRNHKIQCSSTKTPFTTIKPKDKTRSKITTIHDDTSDFAVKFFLKDGRMNRIVSTRTSPPTPKPSEQDPPAKAPSPPLAPQPTTMQANLVALQPAMQANLVAPYPDLLDPNNYCKCCNRTFTNQEGYRQHCRTLHTLPLPDPNDPNFFCYVCNLTSPDLFTYRKHMRKLHLMKGFPEMFDIKCHHCSRTYANGYKYSNHLRKVAKSEEKARIIESRPPPTWDEPNFHCSKCLKTFADDRAYKGHLRYTHGMTLKMYKNYLQNVPEEDNYSNEALDKNDAHKDHFFCFACRKDFLIKHEFHQHLKTTHKLNLSDASIENLKIASSPNVFAKPLDPTLYYSIMKGVCHVDSK